MTAIRSKEASTTQSATKAGAAIGQISPAQVRQWLYESRCVLIDVREPDEHAREHIPGSKLLPLSCFDPAQAAAMAAPRQAIVLHCRGGSRSADACRMAASLACSGAKVLSMSGGIDAWKKDALPVEVDTRVSGISVMRQVQMVIGVAVLIGSALAWFLDPRFIAVPVFFGTGLTVAGATGTCGLAAVIGCMPWNRAGPDGCRRAGGSCR
ncbi:MAG: rhodanese-like domain-containing protein [Phycisphaerales bacterium]|nr:rhodanese-like domain-containing protein [Phycisphaerales bacterium]